MFSTIFSSFLPVTHADAPDDKSKDQSEENRKDSDEESKAEDEGGEAKDGEDAEEDEPEDILPTLRDECSNSGKCVEFKKHFDHCQEKVEAGEGYKGEDCVEEMCTFISPLVIVE